MEINERAHQYEQGQIGVEEGIIYKKKQLTEVQIYHQKYTLLMTGFFSEPL